MGTGDLGKIHLEILEVRCFLLKCILVCYGTSKVVISRAQCIGLPNLDVGGFLGNKTDAFVAVVYEDACKLTSVTSLASRS